MLFVTSYSGYYYFFKALYTRKTDITIIRWIVYYYKYTFNINILSYDKNNGCAHKCQLKNKHQNIK